MAIVCDSEKIVAYYMTGLEEGRLNKGHGLLEWERTKEILLQNLPPPPAVIWDVGGGPGRYAVWLATMGYEVHLVDPVPLHIEQARHASNHQPDFALASIALGDARQLACGDGSADVVLLFGPLYHLVNSDDRLLALHEARRILRPKGLLFATSISRFASLFDGIFRGVIDDPSFAGIIDQDLCNGQHRNPTNNPTYFTTAYFHAPAELETEVQSAGFLVQEIIGIEGPTWALQDFDERWHDPQKRNILLQIARKTGKEASIIGASAHLLAIAQVEE